MAQGDDAGQAARALRDAFASWASGVTVVAVHTPGGMRGITVSAFSPLSLDPQLVLICLAADAPMLSYIREQRRYTVNVLAADQKRTAGLYSDRFTAVHARFTDEAEAIIDGALASFVCTLVSEHEAGDHRIIVGEIQRFCAAAEASPLLRFARAYRMLA